jgi:periplasmic divalent cation tolerance protein
MSFIIIYITYETKKDAEKTCRYLLEKRLVACANIYPIKSMYWWKGEITDSDEYVSILKTPEKNWERIKEVVAQKHPYDTPCIMKLDAEANPGYEEWIRRETAR